MASIVMYTKSWCPYCDRAKSLLTQKGQTWSEIDVEAEPERMPRGGCMRQDFATTTWFGETFS